PVRRRSLHGVDQRQQLRSRPLRVQRPDRRWLDRLRRDAPLRKWRPPLLLRSEVIMQRLWAFTVLLVTASTGCFKDEGGTTIGADDATASASTTSTSLAPTT